MNLGFNLCKMLLGVAVIIHNEWYNPSKDSTLSIFGAKKNPKESLKVQIGLIFDIKV